MTTSPISLPEPKRELPSLTAGAEKRLLVALAGALPAWVSSDQLTLLGLAALAGAGLCYWQSAGNPAWLLAVNVCLFLNWFGDSLDGTLARVRRCPRPRYGFYVDHVVDAIGALFLLLGLAASGLVAPAVAIGLLLLYNLLAIHIGLRACVEGRFQIAYGGVGGTELRILLVIANAVVFWWPPAATLRVFDALGLAGCAGLVLLLQLEIGRTTGRLYREEPLP